MASLRPGALSLLESVVMGLGGSAPGFSIATATAVLLGTAGAVSINALLVFALPMLAIALAYKGLNRTGASAGAAFAWTTRDFGRLPGFLSGWAVLVSSVVFMVSGSVTLGTSLLDIVAPGGAHGVAHGLPAVLGTGGACYLAIGLVLIAGIGITSRVQVAMTAVELAILGAVAVAALLHVRAHGAVAAPSRAWLGFAYTPSGFAATAMVVVFFYWGWDVTCNLGEETTDEPANAAGSGGFLSVFVTIGIFVVFTAIAQMLFPLAVARGFASNMVAEIARAAGLGPAGAACASVAVALSSIATLETSMLQFSRTLFAMGRDRAMPVAYARIDPRTRTPVRAMVAVIVLGLAFVLASAFLPDAGTILADGVSATAIQVCFYYGLTGLNCAWAYRGTLEAAPLDFLAYCAAPLAGAVALSALGVYAVSSFGWLTDAVGIGGLAIGLAWFRPRGWGGAG